MSTQKDKQKHQEENLEQVENALSKSEAFIEQNQNKILIAIAVFVVGFLAITGYSKYVVEPKEKEAQNQIFKGEVYFEKDSFNLALNGDGDFLGMLSIIDDYKGTKTGNLARYYAGVSYMHLGNYQEAIDELEAYKLKDELIAPAALGALGNCYLELNDFSNAIAKFQKAASYDNILTAPVFLKKLGVSYELNGDFDKAVETYTKIKNQYKNSAEAREIDKFISRALASK